MKKLSITKQIRRLIKKALEEDIQTGDITTENIIPIDLEIKGAIIAEEKGILAGTPVTKNAFHQIDENIFFQHHFKEGDSLKSGDKIISLKGKAQSILTAERTALNFLQHLSGIATYTKTFLETLHNSDIKILDTRKTTPLLRQLEKYAVKLGGGTNHRFGLYDMVLIKDNHLICLEKAGRDINKILQALRGKIPSHIKIEVEVETLSELKKLPFECVDIVMLDNMNPTTIAKAIQIIPPYVKKEVSGNISLSNIKKYSKIKGLDYISIGALTNSAPRLDLSLEIYS